MERLNRLKKIDVAWWLSGIIFFLFLVPKVNGQEFTAVKNLEAVQAEINKSASKINTIKSRFVQEKYLSFMKEPVKSEGFFRYKKENQLRWEYTVPFKYLILFNGDKIVIKSQDKTNVFDAGSNAIFKQINDLMLGSVKGDLAKNKDFSLIVKESASQYQLILKPKNEKLKGYISGVEIYFERADLAVSIIKIIESTGDYTRIMFKDRIFNEAIDEKTFSSN